MKRSAITVAVAALLLTTPALAREPFQVSDDTASTPYDQPTLSAAADGPAGTSVVVWYGRETAGGMIRLYARALGADGAPTGPVTEIAPAAGTPAVAYNPRAGEYLVVWIADRIYARRLGV